MIVCRGFTFFSWINVSSNSTNNADNNILYVGLLAASQIESRLKYMWEYIAIGYLHSTAHWRQRFNATSIASLNDIINPAQTINITIIISVHRRRQR